MTPAFIIPSAAASPRMVLLSLLLHGLFLVGAVVLSYSIASNPRFNDASVTRVKLVELRQGPAPVDKITLDPKRHAGLIPQEVPADSKKVPIASKTRRRTVKSKRARVLPAKSTIRLKERKRPLQRVDPPAAVNKPPVKRLTKKEHDPEAFIRNRVAAIRKQVESKNVKRALSDGSGVADANKLPEAQGTRSDGVLMDEEALKWFHAVRSRVNSNWSVFGRHERGERITVIAVRVGDDGGLLNASIYKSSSDRVFDLSAMRAVHQAAPFPAIPPTLKDKIRNAGGLALRFTPAGVQ